MTEARLTIEAEHRQEEDGPKPKRFNRLQRIAIGLVVTSAVLAGAVRLLFHGGKR